MPTFAPFAASGDKKSSQHFDIDQTSLFNDSELGEYVHSKSCCSNFARNLLNNRVAQYVKLVSLVVIAMAHFVYIDRFLEVFAAMDRTMKQNDYRLFSGNLSFKKHEYDLPLSMTMMDLQQYNQNLMLSLGIMCASLATTATILLLKTKDLGRKTMIWIKFADALFYALVGALLFVRIGIAMKIRVMIPMLFKTLGKHVEQFGALADHLSCSFKYRPDFPLCASLVVNSIFPVKLIEYLLILVVLTGAYIALAYLIEWCIRHYFPPTHARLSAVNAISRNFQHKLHHHHHHQSRSEISIDENILVSP